MKAYVKYLLILSAFTFVGCKKSDPGSSSPVISPLSETQKSDFTASMSSLADVRSQAQGSPTSSAITTALPQGAATSSTGPIRDAIRSRCTFTSNAPATPVANSNLDLHVSATGDNCPVTLDYSVKLTYSSPSQGNATMDMNYAVTYALKDGETALKTAQDIDKYSLSGKLNLIMTSTSPGSGSIKYSGSGGGTFHSQKKGDIRTEHSANIDLTFSDSKYTGGGEIRYLVIFPDYNVELKETFSTGPDGKPIVKYLMNGNEISAAEFTSYSKSLTTSDGIITLGIN